VVDTGIKWADLVRRSIMTHFELYPREVWGKPTMKSMQMFSHFHSGMLKGCRFLAGLKWSALTLWHVSPSNTYLVFPSSFLCTRNSSLCLDTFCWYRGGWSIYSNGPHPWSYGEAQHSLGPQGDPWTTDLPWSLVRNTVLPQTPAFVRCAPFRRPSSKRRWHLPWWLE
jgi:hypothetical protein